MSLSFAEYPFFLDKRTILSMDHNRFEKPVSIDPPRVEFCAEEAFPLPPVPGGWHRTAIDVDWTTIDFAVPVTPDALLDLPEVQEANRLDDSMPYWATLWPAAETMSRMLATARWPEGTHLLEVGCGLGLVGIAALLRGWDVHMTDGERATLAAARHNAALNGFPHADVSHLDWRHSPSGRYPVILACDVLYEVRFHEPLLTLIESMLDVDGCCWVADPGRTPLVRFVHTATERGFDLTIKDADGDVCGSASRGQFQLLELKR